MFLPEGGAPGRPSFLVTDTPNPYSPIWVRRFLRDECIRPSRRLGQNFLADRGAVSRIVASSGLQPEETALEVGPGLGALTTALSLACRRVVAVEVDSRLAETLQAQFEGNPAVQIIRADFLKMDLDHLLETIEGPVRVVANIPYSITSPIIEKLLGRRQRLSRVTLLVQKEVAERLTAAPGGRDYSSFTVFCALQAQVRVEYNVSRRLFVPEPEVDSSVITLTPLPLTDAAGEQWTYQVVRAAFGERRKHLPNALANGLGISKEEASRAVEAAGFAAAARAEELSPADFMRLASALKGEGCSGSSAAPAAS